MVDDLGAAVPEREYNQVDMDTVLVLNQRTRLVAKRVLQYLNATDPFAKTIVFCEDIDHAERMRAALVNEAGERAIEHPKYVVRITGDSADGKAELDNFIDPESRYPGDRDHLGIYDHRSGCADMQTDRARQDYQLDDHFKQTIGRGTRIAEEYGKFFFTIMDFKKATTLFNDPDFDGEPVAIYEPDDGDPPVPPEPEGDGLPERGRRFRRRQRDAQDLRQRRPGSHPRRARRVHRDRRETRDRILP